MESRKDCYLTLTIRPLPGMPVIRDLVVDMDLFWKQYESVKSWLINADAPPEQERLQSPEERERLADLDDAFRLFRCRGVLNCVAFCPRQLNPRSAIARTQS